MRYTEKKYESKDSDLLGVVVGFFVNLMIAPYRFVSEVSNKVVYLGREAIEKLCLVAILIQASLILWDCIWYIFTDNISLWGGPIPLGAKIISLAVMVWVSLYLLKTQQTDYLVVDSSEEDAADEVYEEEELSEEIPNETDQPELEPEISEYVEPVPLTAESLRKYEAPVSESNPDSLMDLFYETSEPDKVPDLPSIASREDFFVDEDDMFSEFDSLREDSSADIPVTIREDYEPFTRVSPADILSSLQAGELAFKEHSKSGIKVDTANLNLDMLFREGDI